MLWSAIVALLLTFTGTADLEVFVRPGCPRCAEAKEWLAELQARRPEVTIALRDIVAEPASRERFDGLVRERAVQAAGVPAFHVRGELVIGWNGAAETGALLERLLDGAPAPAAAAGGDTCSADETPESAPGGAATCEPPARELAVDVPWLGPVSPSDLGFPIFTIVLGLVDGFNPCAMWVLLLLLSFLVNVKDRGRMAAIAGAFVLTGGVIYFAFMAAWLHVFLLVGLLRPVQLVLGVVALAAGLIHVKDFFAWKRGLSLSIPESQKPRIYRGARRIMQAEALVPAILAAVVLAALVNLVELLCTAGIPALYTQALAMRAEGPLARYAYLGLYNLAYIFDDSIMVGVAVVTLGKYKLQERGGRILKLISGAVLVVLAVFLLVWPNALTL